MSGLVRVRVENSNNIELGCGVSIALAYQRQAGLHISLLHQPRVDTDLRGLQQR